MPQSSLSCEVARTRVADLRVRQLNQAMLCAQFEKVLSEFDNICPEEMDRSKGGAYDKMLTVIKVQTALNGSLSLSRADDFQKKVRQLLKEKDLAEDDVKIRRKLLAAKGDEGHKALLDEFGDAWLDAQLRDFLEALKPLRQPTELGAAISQKRRESGGDSIGDDHAMPAARPAAVVPRSTNLKPSEPKVVTSKAKPKPAPVAPRSTNLTPWQLKLATSEALDETLGRGKGQIHDTFVSLHQVCSRSCPARLPRPAAARGARLCSV